jgi:hypothetical protein
MQQISQTHHANPTSCLFQLVPQLCQGEAVQQPPLPRTTLAQRGGVVGAHVAPGAAVALKGQRVQGGSGGQTSHNAAGKGAVTAVTVLYAYAQL